MPNYPIPIVDIFAGPGGLGEGFSRVKDGKAFKIVISIEKDFHAIQTLRLRAFYRALIKSGKNCQKFILISCRQKMKKKKI